MGLGSILGWAGRTAFKGAAFAGKQAYRGARYATEFGAGFTEGTVNAARGVAGMGAVNTLAGAAQTGGAAAGGRLAGHWGTALRTGGSFAAGTTSVARAPAGLAMGAGRLISRGFMQDPAGGFGTTLNNPLGILAKRGTKWAVGLGALGVGAGLGAREGAMQRRMGHVTPYGHMPQLDYDAVPNAPRQDMGATGDLVFALNNLR